MINVVHIHVQGYGTLSSSEEASLKAEMALLEEENLMVGACV